MRLLSAFIVLCALAGCGGGGAERAPGEPLRVVGTTSHAAELAHRVMCPEKQPPGTACDGAEALIDGFADPHDYELRPDDVRLLSRAHVIVRSGGEVDEWLDEAIVSSGASARVVTLLDAAGGADPHWWTDPQAARKAVEAIRDTLVDVDPANGARYRELSASYLERLATLDRAIAGCVRRVPADKRRIVTSHDALQRFADRYGVEIVETVVDSRSTEAQVSSGQVAELVRRIKAAGVTAIFDEGQISRDVERAIAEETGVRVGTMLRVDGLGDMNYHEATAHNARAIVESMSGGAVECSLPS